MQTTNLNNEKLETAKKVIQSSAPEVLGDVREILRKKARKYSDHNLNEHQLHEIALSRKQISNGQTVDWADLKKRMIPNN